MPGDTGLAAEGAAGPGDTIESCPQYAEGARRKRHAADPGSCAAAVEAW
ncbi:MAG: hypothetical protein V3T81_08185 [Thermoanaerobaculia bacterium]